MFREREIHNMNKAVSAVSNQEFGHNQMNKCGFFLYFRNTKTLNFVIFVNLVSSSKFEHVEGSFRRSSGAESKGTDNIIQPCHSAAMCTS